MSQDSTNRTASELVALVRELATQAEDNPILLPVTREQLLTLLPHPSPAVRNAVAEAFWQVADVTVVAQLRAALSVETHSVVFATIQHVLYVFGSHLKEPDLDE